MLLGEMQIAMMRKFLQKYFYFIVLCVGIYFEWLPRIVFCVESEAGIKEFAELRRRDTRAFVWFYFCVAYVANHCCRFSAVREENFSRITNCDLSGFMDEDG